MPRRITTRSSAKAKKSTLKKSSKKAKITAKLLPAPGTKNVAKRRTTRSQVRKKDPKKTIKKNGSSQINGLLDTVIGDVFGKMNRTAMLEEKEAREFEKERKIRLKKFMAGELSDDEYEQPSTSKKFKASGSRKPFPWERVKEMAKKTANLHKRNAFLEENEDSDESAQKTYVPIETVPLNYGVPYEKLIDILKFVDRHESEKCLLVSKRWSSIVASSEKNLPCREKIQIYNTNNVFWLKRKGAAQERITESKAEILRKCLCTKFEILRFNDEVMEELEQVSKFAGRQIATNEVHFTVDDDFDEMGILKFLPKILKKIIRAQKVVLILKAKVLNMIFKNPGLLTIPDPPREVDLKAAPSYYVYGGKYSDATGICASVKVLNFIQHNKELYKPNRFSLHFESQLDGFWEKYVDYFLKTKDLERLPRCIQIDAAVNTTIFESMKKYLKNSHAIESTEGTGGSKIYIYKFRRQGGAILKIVIGPNLPTYYTVLMKEDLDDLAHR